MTNRLDPIILQKQIEVAALRQLLTDEPSHRLAKVLRGEHEAKSVPSFRNALLIDAMAIIAEIKRKSPSKGKMADITDPVLLAQRYIAGGASALSVLTDQKFFGGHLDDLVNIAAAIHGQIIPILRKEFIIDTLQIAEAAAAGASAVLCIVAVLGKQTREMLEYAHTLGLDVLVEIHDRHELDVALDSGADIIGINNRDLTTFTVNTDRAFEIAAAIPAHIIKVAESGITHPSLVHEYYQAGFNAVLIGEALVTSSQPEEFIRECHYG